MVCSREVHILCTAINFRQQSSNTKYIQRSKEKVKCSQYNLDYKNHA